MTFDELKGALILISYDAVSTEDYIKSLYAKIDVEIEDLFDNSAMRKVLRIVERSNRCWNRKYFFKKHI